jgi:diacylglycerol kinase (ATP)
MHHMKKALIIHSPYSGRSTHLTQAIACLQQAGVAVVDLLSIASLDRLPPQGGKWQANGIDLLVAAGGDGLVGGLLRHLVTSKLPLGILPLGTFNNLARSLNIPLDIQDAAAIIASGEQREIDLGHAHLTTCAEDAESTPLSISDCQPLFFAHALSIGLKVQFARYATDAAMRQQYGALTYPAALIEAMKAYTPIDVELRFDGLQRWSDYSSRPVLAENSVSLRCPVAQVTVVNAPLFWGPLQARVPGVSLHDRTLDIIVVEDADPPDLLSRIARFFSRKDQRPIHHGNEYAHSPALQVAERTDIPGIHHLQAHSVTITTPGRQQEITLDGEIRAQTPITASVADESVCLMVPPSRVNEP